MTIEQLKVVVYDQLVIRNNAERAIQALEAELQKRANKAEATK